MNWQRFIDVDSNGFLFLIFLSVISGFAFGFADVYDHMSNVDVQTYVGLSEFDFDQHPVRRYRVIIPMLAAGIYAVFSPVLSALSPNNFPGDFARIMSFVIVNSALMAIYAVLIFKIVAAVIGKSKFWPAIIGVISVDDFIFFVRDTKDVDDSMDTFKNVMVDTIGSETLKDISICSLVSRVQTFENQL